MSAWAAAAVAAAARRIWRKSRGGVGKNFLPICHVSPSFLVQAPLDVVGGESRDRFKYLTVNLNRHLSLFFSPFKPPTYPCIYRSINRLAVGSCSQGCSLLNEWMNIDMARAAPLTLTLAARLPVDLG